VNGQITALAPWAGSKRTLAPRIVEAIGPHGAYFEPFCGSMSVLFEKQPARHEVVNDLNRDLVNVARVLQAPDLARDLLARLHFTLAAEEPYRDSRSRVLDPHTGPLGDVERAYHAMVTWWLGRNGMAGTRQSRTSFAARFTPRGGSGGVRFRSMIESVPFFVERLARVDVLNRDGFDVLAKIDDADGVAIYLDPPYLRKSFEYAHDFKTADHCRLAAAASRFKRARVVVSYYDHPDLAGLYPPERWDWHRIEVTKMMRNTNTRAGAGVKAVEVLLVNRRPADADSPKLFGAA
jgi:DNA adenine methylase